jgi:sulfite dehydrogenase (cytochrome) subunit B
MQRPLLLAAVAMTALMMSRSAHAQASLKLVSPPEVDLPFGDAAFPEGRGSQATSDNCLACHSADHVLNQPSLSKEGWEEVVQKMVRAYKAPISPEDAEKIVGYLAATKGLK